MEPFRYHVFVCDQQKPEGVPCCSARGSAQILEALRSEIAMRGLADEVQVTTCGSLGLCEHGPNMIVYPEGVWYSGVAPEDLAEIVRSHFEQNTPVERLARTDPAALRAEVVANREKMMAARRAKEAAGALPDDLNDRIRAFQESRVILTALELDSFTAIGTGATAAEASAKMETNHRATEMLLNALASMGLLIKCGEMYHNTPATARYFTAGSPDNARLGLLHTANLWVRWSTLTECVRSGRTVMGEEVAERGAEWTQAFIAAMHRNAAQRSGPVVRAVGAAKVRRMLDIGGGSGAYSIAFAKAHPGLHADIVDLPMVLPIAQRHIEEAGVQDRVQVRVGDLRSEGFGADYDLVFVSAICHMLSPEENRDLFHRARQALGLGGRIVIQDFILEDDKTAPKSAALFALNMLVGTRAGSTYSEAEYTGWLSEAGFGGIRRLHVPGPAGLIEGTR